MTTACWRDRQGSEGVSCTRGNGRPAPLDRVQTSVASGSLDKGIPWVVTGEILGTLALFRLTEREVAVGRHRFPWNWRDVRDEDSPPPPLGAKNARQGNPDCLFDHDVSRSWKNGRGPKTQNRTPPWIASLQRQIIPSGEQNRHAAELLSCDANASHDG